MAREATARLYDVDEHSVTFKKLNQTEKYDQGVITFRARKGKLIDLDKLHESVWASRLAHSTRSGLVSLDVVVIGEAIQTREGIRLKVSGVDSDFVVVKGPSEEQAEAFAQLAAVAADEGQAVRLTGQIRSLYRESAWKDKWNWAYDWKGEKRLPVKAPVSSREKVDQGFHVYRSKTADGKRRAKWEEERLMEVQFYADEVVAAEERTIRRRKPDCSDGATLVVHRVFVPELPKVIA